MRPPSGMGEQAGTMTVVNWRLGSSWFAWFGRGAVYQGGDEEEEEVSSERGGSGGGEAESRVEWGREGQSVE